MRTGLAIRSTRSKSKKSTFPKFVPTKCWSTSWRPGSISTTSGPRSARPVDVIGARQKAKYDHSDFHIGGSDASGIVYAIGREVSNVKVGDRVVIHCGVWDRNCPVGSQRRRSDVRSLLQDLGLRNQLGKLCAIHPRAGASVHAQGKASHLGGSRGTVAGRRDCDADADGMAAARRAPRTTWCSSGEPRADSDAWRFRS